MKKIIFALPLCALFTYCSSSRKVTAPPAGPGISNVSIVSGTDTVRGANIKVSPETRDFAYTSTRETTLQGGWTLQAMASEDGSWSTTDLWYKDTTTTIASDSVFVGNMESPAAPTGTTAAKKSTSKSSKKSAKSFKATSSLLRYDSLMSNSVVYNDSTLNANIQPYKYWTRIPSVTLNPTTLVFSGNTGCNSMSGSFNFSGKDFKFNKNITTSKMACNEYNEAAFLNALRRADNYSINNEGMLEFRQGQTALLVFRKQM